MLSVFPNCLREDEVLFIAHDLIAADRIVMISALKCQKAKCSKKFIHFFDNLFPHRHSAYNIVTFPIIVVTQTIPPTSYNRGAVPALSS